MKSFVDSNVLVYLFDKDSPNKKAVAQRILQTEGTAGNLLLSTQVLQEFYVTVTRKLAEPLKLNTALEAVRKFAAFPIVTVDVLLILAAIRRSQNDSISFWDSLIIDAALKGGSQRLWSEDLQHGRVVNGMRIENPFV
jgi:predicted nucleic acid-binding protein